MIVHPVYIPITPAGSQLTHLEAKSEEEAWQNLIKDASHMPYKDMRGFIDRGYTVEVFIPHKDEK